MKLDILMKLIALANNNPNEHEANLAARKVCKALNEFTITEALTRTTKPDFKSTRPSPNPYPFGDIYEEWFKRARQYEYSYKGTWTTDDTEEKNQSTKREKERYYKRRAERSYGNNTRELKCKTCGVVKGTIFTGLEELFECNECQWTAYTKKSQEKDRRCGSCRTPIICISTNYCARKGCAI